MGRWVPDAQGRLIQAAMDLFSERGFEQTTVDEIAKRAGLTERTFFRHFEDKREVLFFGSELPEKAMVNAVAGAPPALSALDAIGHAIVQTGVFFDDRRPHSRRRQSIIDANPELQERERRKMASIGASLTRALSERGVRPTTAAIASEIGIAVFRIAFEQWLNDARDRAYEVHVRAALEELRSLSA